MRVSISVPSRWNVCGTCKERFGGCQAAAAARRPNQRQEIGEQDVAVLAGDAFGVELDAVDRQRLRGAGPAPFRRRRAALTIRQSGMLSGATHSEW